MTKLLLIDGLSVLRRVYEANPAQEKTEKAQDACKKALSSFARIARAEMPTHALVCFDEAGKTWRHSLFEAYRCGRKPMDEELRIRIPQFRKDLRERLGLASVSKEGFEADDLVASATKAWRLTAPEGAGLVAYSTDKDIAVLGLVGAKVRHPFSGDELNEAWVKAKFNVNLGQLQDLLALAGDTSDSIPGAPGIGAKKGAALLAAHHTLEGVIEFAKSQKNATTKLLSESADKLRIFRKLVSLDDSVSLGLTWRDIKV